MELLDFNFSEEQLAILNENLLVDGNAWSIDQAHARKHGKVAIIDLRDRDNPKVELRDDVAVYQANPTAYFQRHFFWDSHGAEHNRLTAVVTPRATATARQQSTFDAVSTALEFMLRQNRGRVV